MIEIIRHNALTEIKLNRPPVNALNFDMLDQLVLTFEQVVASDAKGILLSGGSKVFSGGLDVPYLLTANRTQLKACWARFFDAARVIAKSPVPVATAIAGHNPAGGCVLALCCDSRVMTKGAFRIGLNETQVGLIVPEAIQYLLRRLVGAHRAERMIVAGSMIEAEQALSIGLVDELCEAEHVHMQALHWLNAMAALPQSPMRATRAIARTDLIQALDRFTDHDLERFVESWYTAETQSVLQKLFVKK